MVHTSVGCQQLRQVRPIGMGVSIAALGDTVLVDCTGTAKSPYSCRPVIYSNKSLSILDYKSEVHIKCGESKKKYIQRNKWEISYDDEIAIIVIYRYISLFNKLCC